MYCTVCGDSTVNDGQNNHLHNPVAHLSDPVSLLILSFLPTQDVNACSAVSGDWRRLSEDHTLWSSLEALLKIPAPLGEGENPRPRVNQKIAELQSCVKESDPLLSAKILTEKEITDRQHSIAYCIGMYAVAEEEWQDFEEERRQMQENKMVIYDQLQKGLAAHVLLRRVGLSSYENLESYAERLLEQYAQENGWSVVVVERVQEGEIEEAERICNTHLSPMGRCDSLGFIIRGLYMDQRLDDMFECLKRNRREGEKNKKIWEGEAVNNIIGLATSLKRYDLIESVIDEIELDALPGVSRILTIFDLLEKGTPSDDMRVFRKYQKDLLTAPAENYILHRAIPLLVKFGDIEGAWKNTLQNRDQDKLVLYVLRNAFANARLFEEMEKVKEMIALESTLK